MSEWTKWDGSNQPTEGAFWLWRATWPEGVTLCHCDPEWEHDDFWMALQDDTGGCFFEGDYFMPLGPEPAPPRIDCTVSVGTIDTRQTQEKAGQNT
jgi:hypothetical protein